MKLFYFCLAILLIIPCPYCWVGESVLNYVSEISVSQSCHGTGCNCSCSASGHSHDSGQEKNQSENHQCPCQCHAKDMSFAQIIPPVDVRGIAMDLSVSVDQKSIVFEKNTICCGEVASVQQFLTLPLRI